MLVKITLPDGLEPIHFLTAGQRGTDYFDKLSAAQSGKTLCREAWRIFRRGAETSLERTIRLCTCRQSTGITDIGGVCTIQLPDILLMLLTPNEQNLRGTIEIAEKTNVARKRMPLDRLPLIIAPILSRLDPTEEFAAKAEWMDRLSYELSEIYAEWLSPSVDLKSFLAVTFLPYIAYFSFGEKLPVLEQGVVEPSGLGYAYATLSALIANRFQSAEQVIGSRSEFVRSAREHAHARAVVAQGPIATHGGALASKGAVAFVGDSNLVVSGNALRHLLNVYRSPMGRGRLGEKDFTRILSDYLRWVQDAHDHARLFGMESASTARVSPRPELTDIFIPLIFRHFSPPPVVTREEALKGKSGIDALLAWRKVSQSEDRSREIVPFTDLLTVANRIAVVGNAGSGKSTILSYLAATLAQAIQTNEAPPYKLRSGLMPVPLFIPLRYYRDYLLASSAASSRQLDDPRIGTLAGFIPWYLRRRNPVLGMSEDFFDRLLLGGGCLLMLDGLDEVVSREQRGRVRQEVESLVNDVYPGNQVIVTPREVGYREEAVFGDDFVRLDIQALSEAQISGLVAAWCRRLYPEDVAGKTTALMTAIAAINSRRQQYDLPPLVSNPLMVNMVATLYWGERELPRERALLYEACVKAILQEQYIPDDPARQMLVNWGGPWEAQRDWLGRLALAMHSGGRQYAAIPEEQVRTILEGTIPTTALDAFICAVRYRGGLFEERGEFFQFAHLTFQEFLTDREVAKQREAGRDVLAAHIADSWWREVILLTYGYLHMDYPPAAADYLEWLSNLDGSEDTALAGAEMAGSAVLETDRPDSDLRLKQAERLAKLLGSTTSRTSTQLRAGAGWTLGRLGDPRPGVGLTTDGLPDIIWCEVPADASATVNSGAVGSNPDKNQIATQESTPRISYEQIPDHECAIPGIHQGWRLSGEALVDLEQRGGPGTQCRPGTTRRPRKPIESSCGWRKRP